MMGILNVNKEEGMTSHDVVAILRRVLKTKRIGHSGTLDPMATGVLPVLVGRATRLAEHLTETGKEYRFTMRFGQETDTGDCTGTVRKTGVVPDLSAVDWEEVLRHFTGTQTQRVPLYSAVKVKGKKLYEYAREGLPVEQPVREITIYALKLISVSEDQATMQVQCSKGTYIRQLIMDIGEYLGSVATMTKLVRTHVGPFSLDQSIAISSLRKMSPEEAAAYLQPSDLAVAHWPAVSVSRKQAIRLQQGQRISLERMEKRPELVKISEQEAEGVRVYSEGLFLGTGFLQDDVLKMKKVIADPIG